MSIMKRKSRIVWAAWITAVFCLFSGSLTAGMGLTETAASDGNSSDGVKTVYDVSRDFPGVSDGADVNAFISANGPDEWYYQALNVPAFYQYGAADQDAQTGALTTDTDNTALQLFPQITHGGASPQEIEMKDGTGKRNLPKLIQYPNGNGIADTPDQIGSGGYTASVQYSGIYGGQWVHPGQGLAMVYSFQAPRDGSVYLKDSIRKTDGGDGVQFAVLHQPAAYADAGYGRWGDAPARSLYGAVPVYPSPKTAMQADGTGWQYVAPGTTFDFLCDNFDVKQGDMIHFILDGKDDSSYDQTFFAPSVVYGQVPDRITLDVTERIMKAGVSESDPPVPPETLRLTATIKPEASQNKTVSWTSDNEDVATVSDTGLVTAVAVGTAEITATVVGGIGAEGKAVTASCTVTVVSPDETIRINESLVVLEQAYTTQLTYTILPPENAGREVVWNIEEQNPDEAGKAVISLSETGLVTALNPGEATVRVSVVGGTATATKKVSVTKAGAAVLSVGQTTINVLTGETATIRTTVTPLYHSNDVVSVTLADGSIASAVWSNGVITVTGTAPGRTTLEASVESGSKITVTVNVLAEAEKTYTWRNEFRSEQGPMWYYYLQKPGEDAYVEMEYVSQWWGAYEEDAAANKQKQAGAYRPRVADQAAETPGDSEAPHNQYLTIWQGHFIHPGKDYNAVLGFKAPLTGVIDFLTYFRMYSSGSVKIAVLRGDKQIYPATEGEWQTVDAEHSADATLRALSVSKGEMFYIVVNSNGANSFDSLYLNPQIRYTQYEKIPDTLVLNRTEVSLEVGKQTLLTVAIEPEESVSKAVVWTSDDDTVATVDDFGIVTAVKAGTAVITARLEGGATVSVTVTVNQPAGDSSDSGKQDGSKGCNSLLLSAPLSACAGGLMGSIYFVCKKLKGVRNKRYE